MPKQPAITLLIKPASGNCNLRCRYCFYADEMNLRSEPSRGFLNAETLDILVQKTLRQVSHMASFAFQGGEPTLAGLDFYRHLIELEKKYNTGRIEIHNSLQTNGIVLDEKWAQFLHDNHFLVGLSLDGYEELHDENRKFPDGSGSFSRVMEAAKLLQRFRVDFNILSVVTARSARRIRRIYRFFQEQGFAWQQYIPCIDPFDESKGSLSYSLTPDRLGKFLKDLFDDWYADWKAGRPVYNRTFENWIGILLGQPPEACSMNGFCSEQWVVEADGSVYPCDFYVLDEWKLGNIREDSFEEMNRKREELQFAALSRHVPQECRSCRWYPLCRNGCRRDRVLLPDGRTPGLNAYCGAYQDFFSYAYPRLEEMARTVGR
ncbi:MAG TPA: anaerobic sulfatase maturase [Candidatus Eisenbergiella merdipullorum]|uniref:Anaerobic sulfatase maturase n=1 Tax=Candidatus Eisenbergiella merdipullorum TaxID=2838553 RepID=A0A9D2L091_9FIRM|nr:anaerobic sulfatase maturase [Candidatus Eisenbergiella merdipullorum]